VGCPQRLGHHYRKRTFRSSSTFDLGDLQ
jgi:hypothetical protein